MASYFQDTQQTPKGPGALTDDLTQEEEFTESLKDSDREVASPDGMVSPGGPGTTGANEIEMHGQVVYEY